MYFSDILIHPMASLADRSFQSVFLRQFPTALSKYQKFAQDQQSQLETIQVEFNNKYLDYQKNAETLSESAKQLTERELQDLQKRFDDFQQVAEQDAQKMQQQLMGPVITKAQDAIKKVAQAAGYTIVFDVAAGAMAYYNEATVTNILPLVKKELGIVDKPAAAK